MCFSFLDDDRLELPCLFYNKHADGRLLNVVFAMIFEDRVLNFAPLFDELELRKPQNKEFDEKESTLLNLSFSSEISQGVRINKDNTAVSYF